MKTLEQIKVGEAAETFKLARTCCLIGIVVIGAVVTGASAYVWSIS